MSISTLIPPSLHGLARWVGPHRLIRAWLNVYGPYVGAGVRTTYVSEDRSVMEVQMRLRWFNRNAVGTHFGGSLYSMVDPFFMLILMEQLGRDFIVWDRAASIRFLKPGTGTLRARFEVTAERVRALREGLPAPGDKRDETFVVRVLDGQGEVVAEVDKVVYVRRKR